MHQNDEGKHFKTKQYVSENQSKQLNLNISETSHKKATLMKDNQLHLHINLPAQL